MVSKGVQDMHASGAQATNKAAATLLRKLQWVIAKGEVLGWIEQLPEDAIADIPVSQWEIRSLTLHEALLRPWRNPSEQKLWVARYRAGNRLLEADVEKRALAAGASLTSPHRPARVPSRPPISLVGGIFNTGSLNSGA